MGLFGWCMVSETLFLSYLHVKKLYGQHGRYIYSTNKISDTHFYTGVYFGGNMSSIQYCTMRKHKTTIEKNEQCIW